MLLVNHRIDNLLHAWLADRRRYKPSPEIQFCAYTIPHPTEDRIHMRVQTHGRLTALEALRQGLNDVLLLFQTLGKNFQTALSTQDYEYVATEDL